MLRVLFMVFLLLPAVALAGDQIYRSVDEDGNVVYSDTPPSDDAEPVELEPLTTVPGIDTEEAAQATDGEEADEEPRGVSYGGLEVIYPSADSVVRHNGGQVPFEVRLLPEGIVMPPEHRIEILVDGEVRGGGNATTVTVGPVDRGPHTARARVVDAGGNVYALSPQVNFFLKRHSVQP